MRHKIESVHFFWWLVIAEQEGFIGTTGENTGAFHKILNKQGKMASSWRDATPIGKRCNGYAEELRRFFGRVVAVIPNDDNLMEVKSMG